MMSALGGALRSLFAAALCLGASLTPALADKRVALVIGNGAYANAARLDNPTRDADAVANALRGAGFASVAVERNLGRDALLAALRRFEATADDADWALVYFAGHGLEIGGTNYLLPVDAKLRSDRDIDEEAVSLPQVQRRLDGAKRLRLVILDACRDNPFAGGMKRTGATRSVTRGLAVPDAPRTGSLVAFAADAGQVAADDVAAGGNSPYATALVKNLAEPNVEVNLFFRRVRFDVLNATGQKQAPATYEALPVDPLVFRPALATPPVVATSPSPAMDAIAWRYVNRESASSLKQFLSDYPASAFAGEAQTMVAALEAGQTAQSLSVLTATPVQQPLRVLGMRLAMLSDDTRSQFNIKNSVDSGVIVLDVEAGSQAADKRLKQGDVILEINQEKAGTPEIALQRVRAVWESGKRTALLLVANISGELRFVAVGIDPTDATLGALEPALSPVPPATRIIDNQERRRFICRRALDASKSGWDDNPLFAEETALARSRYSIADCQAALLSSEIAVKPTTYTAAGLADLCRRALDRTKTAWDDNPIFADAVRDLQTRSSIAECRTALGLQVPNGSKRR